MAVLSLDALPVGFRFRPTDEELVDHYLMGKINGHLSEIEVIPEVDICGYAPSILPDKSLIKTADREWFFFSPKRLYSNGERCKRVAVGGYWKPTGRDRSIQSPRGFTEIGKRKTLVYYSGSAPNGTRSNWVIHEYRTTGVQGDFVLCRLFAKPEDKTLPDVITRENVDEAHRGASSPTVARPSPPFAGEDIVEGLTSPNQDVPQSQMQADSLTSDMQQTRANMLQQDTSQRVSSNPLRLNENNGSNTVASDNAENEIDVVGAEITEMPDELANQPLPELCGIDLSNFDYNNDDMELCWEFFKFDYYPNGLQQGLFQHCNEEDLTLDVLDNTTFFQHGSEEHSAIELFVPEMSNTIVPESQKCIIADDALRDPMLSKESIHNNEDIGTTVAQVRKPKRRFVDKGTTNSMSGYEENVGETSGSNIQRVSRGGKRRSLI